MSDTEAADVLRYYELELRHFNGVLPRVAWGSYYRGLELARDSGRSREVIDPLLCAVEDVRDGTSD